MTLQDWDDSAVRTVVVYLLLSLDGVAESPETFVTEWDDALDADLAAVIGAQDAVVLGRRSYDEWSRHWPTSDVEPFATFINGVRKYVATSSPLASEWANSVVTEGDVVEFVRRLAEEPGADIGVHASISLARSLLAAGVVDELRLVVAPTVAGTGRRFFDDLPPTRLDLREVTPTPTGSLLLHYRVGRD